MTKEEFLAIATPRVDAENSDWSNDIGDWTVSRTFARKLERELYIANEWMKKAHEKARRQVKESL